MKKILTLIAVATMAFAMPSQAQIKFGVKGGLNLSNMSIKDVGEGLSNQTGFFVGPTIKLTVPVVGLSFDAAALYDQRSAKIKDTGETLKQQSIQIPINVRYGVGLSSLVNVFIFAGPQFGFNVGDKNKNILSGEGEWTLKSSNLSGNVGVGLTVLSKLQATVNYNFALGKTGEFNAIDQTTKAIQGKYDSKINAWQVALAYYF